MLKIADKSLEPCSDSVMTSDKTYQCFADHAIDYLVDTNDTFCYIPQIDFLYGQDYRACDSSKRAGSTYFSIREGLVDAKNRQICPESCQVDSFELKVRERPLEPLGEHKYIFTIY